MCGVGEAVRVVGQNLLRQKASRQVSEFHAGCCVRPRLLLGHGQLGRTRPRGAQLIQLQTQIFHLSFE